jgi:hypothetical protein
VCSYSSFWIVFNCMCSGSERSRHHGPAPRRFVHAFSCLVSLLLNSRGICLDHGIIHHFFSSRPIHAFVVDSLGRVIRGIFVNLALQPDYQRNMHRHRRRVGGRVIHNMEYQISRLTHHRVFQDLLIFAFTLLRVYCIGDVTTIARGLRNVLIKLTVRFCLFPAGLFKLKRIPWTHK